MVFIMDSSATVTQENFEKEKGFIKSLAKSLGVSPGNSRAALVVYSSNPQLVFQLGEYDSFSEFESKVDNSPYVGHSRRMDKALFAAANVFYQSSSSSPKFVFLLTAGVQSKESGVSSLDEATKPLKHLGVKTYVIAVGSLPDQRELEPTVGRPEDIFRAPSFAKLPLLVPDISDQVISG